MPQFLIQNLTSKSVQLTIEPWAAEETLAPRENAEFYYDEPTGLAVSLFEDGTVGVSIMTNRFTLSVNGREQTFEGAFGLDHDPS